MPKSRFVQFFQRKNNSDHTIRKVIGRHTYRSHRCQPTLAATWNKEKPSSSILISTSFFSSKILWQISILFRNLGAEGTCLREKKPKRHCGSHENFTAFHSSQSSNGLSVEPCAIKRVQELCTSISDPSPGILYRY